MGSESSTVAISEAVFFLSQTALGRLEDLRQQYPQLADELKEGIYAGLEPAGHSNMRSYLIEKAEIVIAALSEASTRSENVMSVTVPKIRSAKKRRLISQVLVLIGSSSVLGATALDGKIATVISAVLTLLAALGNLFAEYQEKLLNPQGANIYDAFLKLGEGAHRSRILAAELKLATSYTDGEDELKELIGKANSLCGELNTWLIQLVV